MQRRALLSTFFAAAAIRPLAALAQQKPMPVIGFLSGVAAVDYAPFVAAFRQGLGDTGFVEGKNVAIDYRWAEGHYDRLPALAAELVALKVDVIAATGGSLQGPAAKRATRTIPIVFTTGSDPVAQGLVADLARPGGNVTGFTLLVADLMEKRLDLLAQLLPAIKVVALLVNPQNSNSPRFVRDLPKAAQERGLQLHVVNASTEGEIDAAFAALSGLHAQALLAGSDAFFNDRRRQIVDLAARYKLPAIYDTTAFTSAGGLMTYGPSLAETYRQVGIYVGKILHGAKPADLPVQRPKKLKLVINMNTAKALGLAVPPSILARADEVIE
ncbi:MAG TPA: ABC transporter substrate-binding protein [Stellaceae bacterium]|nr:ABC transporter substrate-binding protein [Stellaceae bacterium]